MTTIQKTIIGTVFGLLVASNIYEDHHATHLSQQLNSLQQQQLSLSGELDRIKAANTTFSNQLAGTERPADVTSERLRELLRLRGQVGLLRRQQREMQQALAAAHLTSSIQPPPPAPPPMPFQVQLVSDRPDENTESRTNITSGAQGEIIQVNKTPLLDYTAIRSANITRSVPSGEPEIDIELNQEGQELFAAITRENLNKRLAIVMNGQVYAAPFIRSEISDGKAQITGHFTEQEANQLVAQINESIRYVK